ncbi:hypothetical protein IIA94_02130 [Patescibacteria group bacterium]|nr:hypothetical protein [Patescibacteria group bacterium]
MVKKAKTASSTVSQRGKKQLKRKGEKKLAKIQKKPVKMQRKRPVSNNTDGLEAAYRTRIRVIGIGGGGGNIVSEIANRVRRVDFVAANTDNQA